MNDDAAPWESLHILPSPAQPSPNPWAMTPSTANTFTDIPITPNLPLTSNGTRPRGSSTSIAVGLPGTTNITSGPSNGPTSTSMAGGDVNSSSLRSRTAVRRLRSSTATAEDSVHANAASSSTPNLILTFPSDEPFHNGDPYFGQSLNGHADSDSGAGKGKTTRIVLSRTTSLRGGKLESRRTSSREPSTQSTLDLPEQADWDDNDKSHESKARKGKRKDSPFSFGLGGGFGAKLWGDVENLINSTFTPSEDPYVGKGHAYLDVWGQPIRRPPSDIADASRGRERERSSDGRRGANGGLWAKGPLEEREGETSTTPALARKTTDTIRGTRSLTSSSGVDVLDSNERSASRDATGGGEAEVFEHKILPTDSLAGVALKYGITVAQLRKANKMWASDTIHLRKVLYIPVTTTRPSPKPPPGELIDFTTSSSASSPRTNHKLSNGIRDMSSDTPTGPRSRTSSALTQSSSSYIQSDSSASKSLHATPSTKRIPLSELSYFPPPAATSSTIFTSNPHPSTISAATTRKWELENGASSNLFGTIGSLPSSNISPHQPQSRATSPSRGLTNSIFNVFPALNDLNITSRVSFESVRSVGSMPGSGNVSGDEDVELNSIIKHAKARSEGRELRKRVKIKPRAGITVPEEGKSIITEQLAARTMELPVMNSPPPRPDGPYGNKWKDPSSQ